MTPVFGHGRLRLYLLKLLDESPRHGYEIIQQLRERFAGLYAPSAGTVYPRLARLESEGLIRHETDGGRKVYHITDAGRAELAAKAGELEALESEIRASVHDLAEGIRDEVRESARTVREQLEAEAAQTQQRQREEEQDEQRAREGGPQDAAPGRPAAPEPPEPPIGAPPSTSSDWTREQWRAWRREQQENWRQWRREQADYWRQQAQAFREQERWREEHHRREWEQDHGSRRDQRDQWKDWQRAWKEQWARQWKEQWDQQWREQRRSWSGPMGQPWNAETWMGLLSWITSPPQQHHAPYEHPGHTESEPSDAVPDDAGQAREKQHRHEGKHQDRAKGRGRPHDWDPRREWERFGPQLQSLFTDLRREGGALADAARRHGPLNEESLGTAHEILHSTLNDLRDLFEAGRPDFGARSSAPAPEPDEAAPSGSAGPAEGAEPGHPAGPEPSTEPGTDPDEPRDTPPQA
ncbi:MAG TPA: helix-turn-helix transcriptional regulator [Actinocrinis sp.]